MLDLFLGGSVRMPRVFWGNVGRVLFRAGVANSILFAPPVATGSNDNDR